MKFGEKPYKSKWTHLRQKQKEHISNWLHGEYAQFVRTHHRKPRKYEYNEILHEVMNQIQEREIWIPYDEVKKYYVSKIRKWFRKIESEGEAQGGGIPCITYKQSPQLLSNSFSSFLEGLGKNARYVVGIYRIYFSRDRIKPRKKKNLFSTSFSGVEERMRRIGGELVGNEITSISKR